MNTANMNAQFGKEVGDLSMEALSSLISNDKGMSSANFDYLVALFVERGAPISVARTNAAFILEAKTMTDSHYGDFFDIDENGNVLLTTIGTRVINSIRNKTSQIGFKEPSEMFANVSKSIKP